MDWLSDNAWAAWLGAGVLLTVAELVSLDLVLGMLAVGAAGGLVTAALGGHVVLQVLVAAIVSVGMLALVRPQLVRRLHGGADLSLGPGKLVGRPAIVLQEMNGLSVGRVKLDGEVWTASPADETVTLGEGETVRVVEIRGATAYVQRDPTIEK